MIQTAVILAAGMGTRIQGFVSGIPKGFIRFNNETLIERSILQLQEQGINRIVMVTGHLAHYYEELCQHHPLIEIVHNDFYAQSGSMYSFYCCRNTIAEDILLLESDLIYESRGPKELLATNLQDQILISGFTQSGDEVYVEASDGRITGLSKDKTTLKNIAGELVGISKFSQALCVQMFHQAEKMFADSLMVEYEQCVVQTAQNYPVYYLKVDDLVWAEIDDENHFNRVKRDILPRLHIKN